MKIIMELVVMSGPKKGNITSGGVTAPGEFVDAQVTDKGSPFHGAYIPVATEFGLQKDTILKANDVIEAEYHVGDLRELFREPDLLFFLAKL